MIQSQINRDIRLALADQILLSKAKKISRLPNLRTAPAYQKRLSPPRCLANMLSRPMQRVSSAKNWLSTAMQYCCYRPSHCAAVLTIAYRQTRRCTVSMRCCRFTAPR